MDDDDLQAQEWQLPVATTTPTVAVAAAAPMVDEDDQMAQQWKNPPLNNNQAHAQEPIPCDDCWFVSASCLFFCSIVTGKTLNSFGGWKRVYFTNSYFCRSACCCCYVDRSPPTFQWRSFKNNWNESVEKRRRTWTCLRR